MIDKTIGQNIFEKSPIHFLIIALMAVFVLWFFNIYYIDGNLAMGGFSPIHYAYLKVLPENFATNFPSGVEQYDKSLPMHIYPFLLQWFHIPPIWTLKGFIFLEYFSVLVLSHFLVKLVLGEKNHYVSLIFFLLVCSSSALNVNLGNFGHPFFVGQFYNLVDVFRLIGIALFLRNRLGLSFIFLCIGVTIHATQGAFAIFFCLFSLFLSTGTSLVGVSCIKKESKSLLQQSILFAFGCLVFLFLWYMGVIKGTAPLTTMDPTLWTTLAKLGNYHWFAGDMGYFTSHSYRHFIPFLAFLLLFIQYFPQSPSSSDYRVFFGCIGILLLTTLGIVCSAVLSIPFLIKLCPQRSMDLVLFFGLVYVIKGLWEDCQNKRLGTATLGLTILISPFYPSIAPFLIVPIALFTFLNRERTIYSASPVKKWLSLSLLAFLSLMLLVNFFFLDVRFSHSRLDGWPLIGKILVMSGLVIYVTSAVKRSLLGSNVMALVIGSSLVFQVIHLPNHQTIERNQDYLNTQLWAKDHTSPQSLFMVDPTIYYGWRDFSQRSSFGNLREWMHVSWLYSSDRNVYEEGKRRFDLLGLDINNYLGYRPPLKGFDKLTQDVNTVLYEKEESWYQTLHQEYAINYLVLEKKHIKKTYKFDTVYQNNHFIIFKL